MQLFVSNVFKSHNVTDEEKRKLSPEEKQHIRQIVQDLQNQVNEFVEKTKQSTVTEEKVQEASKNTTLREILRRKKAND
jgi:spore coat protein W